MALSIIHGLISLVVILASCELFTNSIEWTGRKLNLSQGTTGSVLAAIGTALPETLIPIVAILFVGGKPGNDIGIGAILGAPFMLSTLAFGITALSAFAFPRPTVIAVDRKVLQNDLTFFTIVYLFAILFSFLPLHIKHSASIIFLIIYAVYLRRTVRYNVGEHQDVLAPLHFRRRREHPSFAAVLLQDAVALAGIIIGARFFVVSIEQISLALNMSPQTFSLLVAPIATELPEKFNSVAWIRRRKDTLALGNISGAMVFQSSVVVFVGVVATDWVLNTNAIISAVITLVSTGMIVASLHFFRKLHAHVLLVGLPLYLLYILLVIGWKL